MSVPSGSDTVAPRDPSDVAYWCLIRSVRHLLRTQKPRLLLAEAPDIEGAARLQLKQPVEPCLGGTRHQHAARLGLDFGSLAILERYERWRRLDSALSAATFDALNRLFSNDSTVLRTARDFGLGLVERMPALKQLLVAEAAGLTGEVPKLLRGERV